MSALATALCGTVCEWHWFDTDPEHIHQPPIALADQEQMERRRVQWVKEGAPAGATAVEAIGPANPRATLYMFMQGLSRSQIRKIAEAVTSNGVPDALEYPCGHLAETLRSMDKATAAEAWELFGQGVKP